MSQEYEFYASYAVFAELCDSERISPYRVGKDLGIASSSLSDWKNGKYDIKIDKLVKLSRYFDVPMNEFIRKRRKVY